jgi:hypothetical protein
MEGREAQFEASRGNFNARLYLGKKKFFLIEFSTVEL